MTSNNSRPRDILRGRVLDYIDKLGWSGAELARRANKASAPSERISQSSVSRITSSDSPTSPTLTTLEAISGALDIPMWSLFFRDAPYASHELKRLERLVELYLALDDEGRRTVERIAELEAHSSN